MDVRNDVQKACVMIKTIRLANRGRQYRKGVSVPLLDFIVGKYPIRSILSVCITKSTKNLNLIHSLAWKSQKFHPETHDKLRCINKRALDVMEQRRDSCARYNNKHKKPRIKKLKDKIGFAERLEDGWYLKEYIRYYEPTGNIYYWAFFNCLDGVSKPHAQDSIKRGI